MTIPEAKDIINKYELKSILSPEEKFMMTEAFDFMIAETKGPRYMVRLGGYYYEQKKFDLALKYYEVADRFGEPWAPEGLGYIWYYGRTGEKDYEKAFKIIAICLWLIYDAFWANSKLIIFGIGGSTLLLYILLHLIIPVAIPENYASTFLGASFPAELILCATPSIIILGIAGLIDNIKWKLKEKRNRKMN